MFWIMFLFPLALAGLAVVVPSNWWRPWLIPVGGLLHLVGAVWLIAQPEYRYATVWLSLDAPGLLVLLVVSLLYFFCALYAVGYLRQRQERSNRVFCACLLGFLGVLTLVTWSRHLGLLWVGIEASTLVTAPLVYFNHTQRSIEATWKYMIVGSVGIALALLGTFFLAYAELVGGVSSSSLVLERLLATAPLLSKPWFHASMVLLLVGYGTKLGLAPMHTWKPEVYGEVPGVVGAIFAGGVTSGAFLAVLRIYQLAVAAGEGAYFSRLLMFLGLFSMAIAGLFMVGQKDFKRLLAYSSVEHMGILAVGLGIGGQALFGTLLHVLTNAMTKGVLFLSAGNIQRAFGSKSTDEVQGAMRRLPLSGALFLLGFLAITGSPPFGPFVSEFSILTGAFAHGRYVTAAFFLILLLVVFIGMGAVVLRVVQGRPPAGAPSLPAQDGWLTAGPIVLLMGLVLLLGLWLPAPLVALLHEAVRALEVQP